MKSEKEEGPIHLEISIPLLIRCLEWAYEDAKSDIEIHKFVERMIALGDNKVLDTDDYDDFLKEDAVPVNNAGSGAIQGIGTGKYPESEPGVSKKRLNTILLRAKALTR